MSIKKSQAILKCFIDLKYSIWVYAGLRRRNQLFCDSYNFLKLHCRSKSKPFERKSLSYIFGKLTFLDQEKGSACRGILQQ